MELNMECGPVLAVCPNTAWQKTLIFNPLKIDSVNRATGIRECGGGKGINVARVLRRLGFPVTVAGFAGGHTGKLLKEELRSTGAGDLLQPCQNTTRCCYTVVDENQNTATELIEPSEPVLPEEETALLQQLESGIGQFSAICLCGSLPPGVSADFYAKLTAMAVNANVPVLLDAFKDIDSTLKCGLTMLKINRSELQQLSGLESAQDGAQQLFARYPVQWLAVTDGPAVAWLFHGSASWRFHLPVLDNVLSPIGAGDCTAAILIRRLAERPAPEKMPACFAEALSCASASCLTPYPSVFDNEKAASILSQIQIQQLD